jgi:type II secretory pathway component PulL
MTTDFRKWLAFGTGVGIEIRDDELQVTVVRVRPSETGVLGSATVTDYRNRPASEWGIELSAFLKKLGAAHIAATVLLPRRDVIVRQLSLPGVANRDLASAVQLQADSLHPFADEEIYHTHARIGTTSSVLVGVARRDVIVRYLELFAEAGIKVASFTFSAASLYSAIRMITPAPAAGFIALHERGGELEVYGESEAKPIFSAALPVASERALSLAASELRLGAATQASPLPELLPKPSLFPANHDPATGEFERNALAYATAVAGACPWLSLEGNLLPVDQRRASSRVRLIPTIALASILLILTGALAAHSSYADSRYLDVLQHEIRRFEPQARRVDSLDRETVAMRARAQAIDEFRRRTKSDMDTVAEITKIIPPPGFVTSMDLDRGLIQLAGEMDQAAVLLKALDESPFFERSQFTMPITRGGVGDLFRVRAERQTPPAAAAKTGGGGK